jgi:hypothetical protein
VFLVKLIYLFNVFCDFPELTEHIDDEALSNKEDDSRNQLFYVTFSVHISETNRSECRQHKVGHGDYLVHSRFVVKLIGQDEGVIPLDIEFRVHALGDDPEETAKEVGHKEGYHNHLEHIVQCFG